MKVMANEGTEKGARTPVMAFVKDEQSLGVLKTFAAKRDWPDTYMLQGNIEDAVSHLGNSSAPEVLFVEVNDVEHAANWLEQLSGVCDEDVKVYVIGSINEYSFFIWLTEIGIAGYLLKPFTLEQLTTLWQKNEAKATGGAEAEAIPTKVIGVMGARGGSGATSLAIYLGALAAVESKKPTSIVDLDPQDGSVSLLLDIEPSRGFREALEKPDRIDQLFLDRVTNRVSENLSIISGEESLHERLKCEEQGAIILLRELKEKTPIVILDLPRTVNSFTHACLMQCDTIISVAEPTLNSLREALRHRDLIRDHLKLPEPVMVLNKVGIAPKAEMKAADFEKGLGNKLKHHVPFAPEVFFDIHVELENIAARKNTPLLKNMRELLQEIMPEFIGEEEPTEQKKGAKGWRKKKA